MDLLGYSDTVLHVCLKTMSRRELHDTLRHIAVYPQKIRVCPCGGLSPWTRKVLAFLGAVYDNEPSHHPAGHGPDRVLAPPAEDRARPADGLDV